MAHGAHQPGGSVTRIFQVDAFTAEPFRGNPAGVVLLDGPRPEAWMQAVAMEMNLAETAFVEIDGDGPMPLRWFTPTVEVPLCGHATLATSHLLWEQGVLDPDEHAVFASAGGGLRAWRDGDGITLDFPAYAIDEQVEPPTAIRALVGDLRGAALIDDLAGDRTWLVELDSAEAVRAFRRADAVLLAERCGLVLTARSDDPGADFVSRCFFPAAGIPEDPVTGAAHCALAPYWAPRLGRTEFTGYQASARGGLVGMRLDGDRVHLHGQAVTVLAGELLV
jgi:predicted PhzF superfamily epimerase YddE/YHI9